VEIDYVLIDLIKRFFSLRRIAPRDNLISFTNYAGFVFRSRRAISQPNACDRRRQMLKDLWPTVCKTLMPNSGWRLRNTCLCRLNDER